MQLSKDLFIIEENKIFNVDSEEIFRQYFDLFGSEFMDKVNPTVKLSKNDKHTLHEEIRKLEDYLLKKNKRFLNVVYLSFKFPHLCELYFKLPENVSENEALDDFNIKKTTLSNRLTEAVKELDELKISNGKP